MLFDVFVVPCPTILVQNPYSGYLNRFLMSGKRPILGAMIRMKKLVSITLQSKQKHIETKTPLKSIKVIPNPNPYGWFQK